uniref:Uncharacterized protein n=1 Tax=Romanomermis culicivorax TaxID=13658 RepID=A0A915K494_ROMCU
MIRVCRQFKRGNCTTVWPHSCCMIRMRSLKRGYHAWLWGHGP